MWVHRPQLWLDGQRHNPNRTPGYSIPSAMGVNALPKSAGNLVQTGHLEERQGKPWRWIETASMPSLARIVFSPRKTPSALSRERMYQPQHFGYSRTWTSSHGYQNRGARLHKASFEQFLMMPVYPNQHGFYQPVLSFLDARLPPPSSSPYRRAASLLLRSHFIVARYREEVAFGAFSRPQISISAI